MDYLVDGYNLLFRMAWERGGGEIAEARSQLISELDRYASLLGLALTVVFDAPLRSEALMRGHFHSLEIIYTSGGESADAYILDYLDRPRSHPITVVSSDKALARLARSKGAHTENCETFLPKLRQRYYAKERRQRNDSAKPFVPVPPKPKEKDRPQVTLTPAPRRKEYAVGRKCEKGRTDLPPLTDLKRWEAIFTDRLKEQ